MTLRAMIEHDIDAVFFQVDDFAETVRFDGVDIPIIPDIDAMKEIPELYAQALSRGEELIFIRARDMRRFPNTGEQVTKDGKQLYINEAKSEMGVYVLMLGRERRYD